MPNEVIQGYRLSPQQADIWRLDGGSRESPYRSQIAVRLRGALDPERLRNSLRWLVRRHEILRTTFRTLDGMAFPLQVVVEGEPLAYACHDLTGQGAPEQRSAIEALIREARQTPLDFENGPLLHVFLAVLSTEESVLGLLVPAMCADLEGLHRLVRELSQVYSAAPAGDPQDASMHFDEPVQYIDVAEALNDLMSSEDIAAAAERWRRQNPSRALGYELPWEDRTGSENGFEPRFRGRILDDQTTTELRRVAGRLETSSAVILQACWAVVLWDHLGGPELVVGAAFDGRQEEELEETLGPLAKYLPIRAELAADLPLRELIESVDASMRELADWQEFFSWDLPGIHYRDDVAGADPRRPPFLPCLFEFQSPPEVDETARVSFSPEQAVAVIHRFKLRLLCRESREALALRLDYDSGSIPRLDAQRLLERFCQCLRAGLAAPATAIGDLDRLSRAEAQNLLVEINDSRTTRSDDPRLERLFEAQAERTPERIAVVCGSQMLSFRELNARAESLSATLRHLGVGAETRVAICAERSPEMVIAVLAVLAAGGAYVPLDPNYPRARLASMLADAQPRVILAQAALADHLPATAVSVLGLDGEIARRPSNPTAEGATQAADRRPGSGHLAYVIYTSGSTGRPKGVMISHRAIVNRLLWMRDTFAFRAEDGLLMKTPMSFDASVWELFLPLFSGARLVLAEPASERDAAALVLQVGEQRVTMLQLVPSMLQVFLEEPELTRCASLRAMFCGGEGLPAELVARFFERLPERSLTNLYGPTECSIDGTFQRCVPDRRAATSTSLVPIGRPIANLEAYLFDRRLRPVPSGMLGELFLAGTGLARCYLERPGLTAERFVPHPESDAAGARAYRTGDLARHLSDGRIEFLGRCDHQVKLRGFRIELGEIEASLDRHPDVLQAVVLARQDLPGNPRLVAYVVPSKSGAASAALRSHLESRLPEYMVPTAFVVLDELPRLPNGKLDRQALPAPSEPASDAARTPRTVTEELLVGVWRDLLGHETVGIDDDFFALGGHSLIAAQLVARLRDVFEVELSMRDVFEAATIAGLAVAVEARRAGAPPDEPPIVPVTRDRELPLSFSQQRLWLLQQLEPDSPAYNVPGGFWIRGPLEVPVLELAIDHIIERHEALRTRFPEVDDRPSQVIDPATRGHLRRIDLTAIPLTRHRQTVLDLAVDEAMRPFDLHTGPLLRLFLFDLDDGEHGLFFNLHHIVSDGLSVGVIVRELNACYEAFRHRRAAPLSPLTVHYADYAAWQRQWLSGAVLASQIDYWRRRLEGLPEVLELPTDRPRPAVQTYRGASHVDTFLTSREAGLRDGLDALGQAAAVTRFMTLLACFKVLLYRLGAGADIVVGTNVANRERTEIEALIGFFVNALVLRTDLGEEPSFRQLLARVRETALGAYEHQDLPFDQVVQEVQPQRNLSVTPLFQVAFEVLEADQHQNLELADLTLETIELPKTTSKFDLTLTMAEWREGFLAGFEYSTDLYDRATIARWAGYLDRLAAAAIEDPDRPITELPILGAAETFQLCHAWNGARRSDFPNDRTLHQLFLRQAERTPDRLAAVCRGQRLTYGELDRRTGRLAALLTRLGVSRGHFVGLLEERNLDFLIGILAILRAGGAYVPFDPTYPGDRLRYMIRDSGIAILLTRTKLAVDTLPGLLGQDAELAHVVCFDPAPPDAGGGLAAFGPGADAVSIRYRDEFQNLSADTLTELACDPRTPAYMLYTSGSTGRPKGAIVRHEGAVNHVWAQREALDLDSSLCFLQSAPSSSDISVWQFLAPVLLGGHTVIVDLETVSDARRLLDVLQRQRVTLFEPVPSVVKNLLAHCARLPAEGRVLPYLEWMMATGEAVPVDLINDWLALYSDVPALNAYGPTEASDDVTQWVVARPLPDETSSLPIGRPLANVEALVLDHQLRPVPIGVAGELALGGICLGSGYWRQPRKTGLCFVPHPSARLRGAVLYRTGDLVRWLADGTLEFLGRLDHQVKVRGFRIELGEIEAALRLHPTITDSAAAVVERHGEKQLVAYLVVAGEAPPPNALRDFLQGRLPDHMVPAAWVVLDEMPLTPAGKIDRRHLPAHDEAASLREELIAPRTPAEEKLLAIWSEVLGHDEIGVETDFFRLGGHSLLAVQVLSRVRRTFEVEIAMRSIFEHPTIADLARLIERSQPGVRASAIRRVERRTRRVQGSPEGILRTVSQRPKGSEGR